MKQVKDLEIVRDKDIEDPQHLLPRDMTADEKIAAILEKFQYLKELIKQSL